MTATRVQQIRYPRGLSVHHQAPLESPWIWRVLLVATVLLMAALFWRTVHRRSGQRRTTRRKVLTRFAAAVCVLALTAVTGLAFLNTYVGYLPTVSSLRSAVLGGSAVPGSRPLRALETRQISSHTRDSVVVSTRIGARALDIPDRSAFIYLPPGYGSAANAHRRYPVVYLLAGYPGRPADWMLAGGVPEALNSLIGTKQAGPMIVVAPDADGGFEHDSECLNQVHGPQIASYLTGTVVHYVDRHFRTLRGRDSRAIGGMSSGGFCALNLALQNQHEYSTIIAFEPYGTPGESVVGPLLGGSQVLYRQNSPRFYLRTMHFTQHFSAFMDAGGDAPSEIRRVRPLAQELAARGQSVGFRVEPGQSHTWKEASAGLPYGLYFAAHHLAGGMDIVRSTHDGVVTFGSPRSDQADGFIARYAEQEARCRRLGPMYRPVGDAHSSSCAETKAVP